jgi:hypothetical protein
MNSTRSIKKNEFREIATKTIDKRNRITLGKYLDGCKRVRVYGNRKGEFLLQPVVEIPASELWLYENEEALDSVKKGLKQAKEGKISKLDLEDLQD